MKRECIECGDKFEPQTLCAGCLDLDDRVEVSGDCVSDLSAAIRRGDLSEAEHLLDRLFENDAALTERVQVGRFSGRAKAA
jgi:hypothetical protein